MSFVSSPVDEDGVSAEPGISLPRLQTDRDTAQLAFQRGSRLMSFSTRVVLSDSQAIYGHRPPVSSEEVPSCDGNYLTPTGDGLGFDQQPRVSSMRLGVLQLGASVSSHPTESRRYQGKGDSGVCCQTKSSSHRENVTRPSEWEFSRWTTRCLSLPSD